MQWFRLYSEFSTDPKVQSLSEAMQRRLIMLMCFKNQNLLQTYTDNDICFAMRISAKECQKMKSVFQHRNFIDENWNLLNWDKRQFTSDSSTRRVRRYREAQRNVSCNVSETFQERYSNGLDTDTDTDIKNKQKDLKVEQAQQFCQEEKPKDKPPCRQIEEAREVFEFWKETMGHPRAGFSEKIKRKILQALKSFDKVNLLDAIRGCRQTPWNRGENPGRKVYDGLTMILADDDKIRMYMSNLNVTSSTGRKYKTPQELGLTDHKEQPEEEKKAIEEIIQKVKQNLKKI